MFAAIVAAIGLGITAVGTAGQMSAANKQAAASARAEELRKRQMQLDITRQKRAIIREATIARAVATSNATAQGAEAGSGLAGGLAQVRNQAGRELTYNNQSGQIGTSIFNANADYAIAGGRMATWGGISDMGSKITGSSGELGRLGNYALGTNY